MNRSGCPFCNYDKYKLPYAFVPGEPGWSINPENDCIEYRCICGNTWDEC